jgi:hypothetical protein
LTEVLAAFADPIFLVPAAAVALTIYLIGRLEGW